MQRTSAKKGSACPPQWAKYKDNAAGKECSSSTVNDAAAEFATWWAKGLACIDEEKCTRLKATLETNVVPAEDLQSLKALNTLACEHFKNFKSVISTNRPLCPGRIITIGSACTGSNADLASAISVAQTLRQLDPKCGFRYIFHCEIDEQKRGWIQATSFPWRSPSFRYR